MLPLCKLASKSLQLSCRALPPLALSTAAVPQIASRWICSSTSQHAAPRKQLVSRSSGVRSRWPTWNSASAAPRRWLSDVRVGDDYEKGQQDESTTLSMEAPFGHEENTTLAEQLGIYKVWEYEDGGKKSMFTMAFQSRAGLDPQLQTLEKFLAADNEMKLKQVPSGQTESTTLPPDVTQYFSQVKVPFQASIFKSNMDGASDSLVFCFQTPGGFWTIAWHVPADLFLKEPDLFFLFLQTIRLSPKNAQ